MQAEDSLVKADADQMKQVFLNLFKNSIEAMAEGGKLEILSRNDSGGKIISVTSMTEPFVGPIKYLINPLLKIYPYHFLQGLCPAEKGKQILYKIRSTFAQSILLIATKDS